MNRRQPKPRAAPPKTKRCAIYTRKSTSAGLEQEFNSLDAQREACIVYIQRQESWTVVDERYDDGGFTGANIERPAFQRLLADLDAGRIDVVVVYKVDRLSRSLLDFARVMERFNAAGASFVSVTQNFSTADAMGRLTLNMLMSFAEFEREMIAERTRDKIRAARRKGQWTGGPVPLGYTVEDKKLVIHELEAVLVREIFALYHEHRSALAVTRALNERGRVAKHGRPWTRNDVLRVLKHSVYAGYISSGGELHEGEHSAIVERVVFSRTQALLAAATRVKNESGRNPEYILRGVLQCARCGSAFTPASTSKCGSVHRYYRCVTRDRQGKEACPSSPLPAGAIEAYVIDRLREATADGSLAADVAATVRARVAARRNDLVIERRKLPPQIAALSAAVRSAGDSLAAVPGAARRVIESRLQDAGEQLARCEARYGATERELTNLDAIEVESSWIADSLAEFHGIWEVLTPENRGRLLRAVIQRVEVDEPANQVRVFITDLSAGIPAAVGTSEIAHEAAP